jgi:hypothetical protein
MAILVTLVIVRIKPTVNSAPKVFAINVTIAIPATARKAEIIATSARLDVAVNAPLARLAVRKNAATLLLMTLLRL